MSDDFDTLPVAVRAFAMRDADDTAPRKVAGRRRRARREPRRALIIDCETTVDASQRLLYGVWRYYVDRADGPVGRFCVEEGIFYADDLDAVDPEALPVLQAFVANHHADVWPGRDTRLRLLSRTDFVEQVLIRCGWRRRALVVGFNLPFDLSRIAVAAAEARGPYAGGISLQLYRRERYRPRIVIRHLDAQRQIIAFTRADPSEVSFRGHFLDLHMLAFALTDRGGTLESACRAFGVDYLKRPVTHGVVTPEHISYCREDVWATTELYRAAMAEFSRHPIELQATKAFSPASLGKSYLRKMGITPPLGRSDIPTDVLGHAMAAFFGGRTECRIRKVALPVIYCDFTSMYPTVNALMGSWSILTARTIGVRDVTARVRRLLAEPNLKDAWFDPQHWPELLTLVEIEPDSEILPVRARYDAASLDFGIGVNPYRLDGRAWYALGDIVASAILTGRAPTVHRALGLVGRHRQGGLRPVRLRGEVEVDPRAGDFFAAVIEDRQRRRRDPSLPESETTRLTDFEKTLANATAYGVCAQFDRHEAAEAEPMTIYADGEAFIAEPAVPEDPGPFCFPPLAACITAAARLMLAMLEAAVSEAGGHYVFCDTDSMAVVANESGGHVLHGGDASAGASSAIEPLSRQQVETIVARFAALNPYDVDAVPGSILKIEAENYDDAGAWRQLWCWAISAKRYVLYRTDDAGEAVMLKPSEHKPSEHGLGHLLSPTTGEGVNWIEQAWEYLLRSHLGLPVSEPAWFDLPALSRITVSSAAVLRWFSSYNADRPYAEQIKPANFLLLAHIDPLDRAAVLPVAPYATDASRWQDLDFVDARTGQPLRITTRRRDGLRRRAVRVRTYRDVIAEYLAHPEAKSLAPDGERVSAATSGVLRRRPVQAVLPLLYVGKEGNRLEERMVGIVGDDDAHTNIYVARGDDDWVRLVRPVLATMPLRDLVAATDLHPRTIERATSGASMPRADHGAALTQAAVLQAIRSLREWQVALPRAARAQLYAYLTAVRERGARCVSCGSGLTGRQLQFCSEICRGRVRRRDAGNQVSEDPPPPKTRSNP